MVMAMVTIIIITELYLVWVYRSISPSHGRNDFISRVCIQIKVRSLYD
jgi:hypothetical protein